MGNLESVKVLIVDDESEMRHLIGKVFSREGATVHTAADGETGLRQFYETRPDLVILDVLMPRTDGWEVLRNIRRMTDVPVIMLTVLSSCEYEVRGFQGGANDYISKPFDVDVLLARAKVALARRGSGAFPEEYNDGYLSFSVQRRQVAVAGKPVQLTPREFDLLSLLVRNRGHVCTFENILESVWGGENQSSAENVHVFVWQLRSKIERDPRHPEYIINVQSVGYRFVGEDRI